MKVKPFRNFEHIYRIIKWENERITLPVTQIVTKLVYIRVQKNGPTDSETNQYNYVCVQPNNFEVQ